jgi:hypothetical protein
MPVMQPVFVPTATELARTAPPPGFGHLIVVIEERIGVTNRAGKLA